MDAENVHTTTLACTIAFIFPIVFAVTMAIVNDCPVVFAVTVAMVSGTLPGS